MSSEQQERTDNPNGQEASYQTIAENFMQHMRDVRHTDQTDETSHRVMTGFYYYNKMERYNDELSEQDEESLKSSWNTGWSIEKSTFLTRMKAKISKPMLLWLNGQIMGNNIAADTYLTLLGIVFYSKHSNNEVMTMDWMESEGISCSIVHHKVLFAYSRLLLLKKNNPNDKDTYLWDVMKRRDLYTYNA